LQDEKTKKPMTFKQPQGTHTDAHTSHKNTSLQKKKKKERKKERKKTLQRKRIILKHGITYLLLFQTISSPEAEDMVVTKC
jgi:hypothetical protein